MMVTPEKCSNFWLDIFIKSSYEKSNVFQSLLNTYFRAFSDLLSCESLGELRNYQTKIVMLNFGHPIVSTRFDI